MARRGFFADLHHQNKMAAREREKAARAEERERKKAEREYLAAVRKEEQARKAQERAEERVRKAREKETAQLIRTTEKELKRLAKEEREAHVAAMTAEVERKNAELAVAYEEIDSILEATLDVDDYVDLESLRISEGRPPFSHPELEEELPAPALGEFPEEPVFTPPEKDSGIRGLLNRRKHANAVERAQDRHELRHAQWQAEVDDIQARYKLALSDHQRAEEERESRLQDERNRYEAECVERERAVAEHNKDLDALITNLGYGTAEAIQEYISIVLSNSVYPDCFPVQHTFEFDSETAELQLRAIVPDPEATPSVKVYKYTKTADAITSTSLSQKACKDRYASAVHQVALRTLHEVFEADRRGLIETITLAVGTETSDPATGRPDFFPFVAVGAERKSFLELNLANVVPAATLEHLGASISKNPYGLVVAELTGVRKT